MLWKPSDAELGALVDDCRLRCGSNAALLDNYIFHGLFNRDRGLYAWKYNKATWGLVDGEWVRTRRRLRMREWIETYVRVQRKDGQIVPMVLNQEQRRVTAMIYRMERLGLPVRITTCKARQVGISTYAQAVALYQVMTGDNTKCLLVADNGDRAEMLLEIANTARKNMHKSTAQSGEVEKWVFKMKSEASYTLEWREPLGGQIKIASAEEPEPGQGGTRKVVHLSETASSSYTPEKIVNILPSLPTLPGTYGFNESTPNGNSGWFYDTFMESWNERTLPLLERKFQWIAMFFAWWEHDGYQWTKTYGSGRQLTQAMRDEILRTLSEDEDWLLKQKYLRRWSPVDEWEQVEGRWRRKGVGWVPVGLDHLAWRRAKLNDPETRGDINLFNQEYASDPMRAFLASGRSVFDREILLQMKREAVPPIWRGHIEEPIDGDGNRVRPVASGLSWDPWERQPD